MNKKIRVLHIFNHMHRGGAETFIMNVYRKIDRNKIQFDFLCTSRVKGDYDDEIKKLGGNIYYIDLPSNKYMIKNINELVKIFKKYGPYEVVHIPMLFYSGIICIAAKIAKIPNIIVHSHSASDGKNNLFNRKLYRNVMRFFINKISTVKLACGEKAGKFLFGKNEKFIVINNGIDINKFQNVSIEEINNLKKKFNIKNEKIIGNIGRFSTVKNHIFFIKLGKYIKDNNLNYKIILIGDGELKSNIKNEIKKNKLEKTIILTGIRKDIPQLLNLMDVLVMPSLYEGFPVTIIESIASGTPCVISDKISSEVAIVPKIVNFLNLEDDISIWLEYIKSASKFDKKYIKKILIDKKFDDNNIVKELMKIYFGE